MCEFRITDMQLELLCVNPQLLAEVLMYELLIYKSRITELGIQNCECMNPELLADLDLHIGS